MKLDLGSLAFNMNIAAGGGTPSWGTSLGTGRPDYFITADGYQELLPSIIYCMVQNMNLVSCPLGKGGNIPKYATAPSDYDYIIGGLFNKIYVNDIFVDDASFLLLVTKENSSYHAGRLTLKYSPKISYDSNNLNDDCFKKMESALGMTSGAAWFVTDIYTKKQDELHFVAYIGDKTKPMTFSDTTARKNYMHSLLPHDSNIIDGNHVDEENDSNISNLNETSLSLQQIFYGAPGTGKSNTIKLATKQMPKDNVFRTTFHPDSDYSTFVGAYKPTMEESSKKPRLNFSVDDLANKLKQYYTETEGGAVVGLQKFCFEYSEYIDGEYMSVNIPNLLELAGVPDSMKTEVGKYIKFKKLIPKSDNSKIVYKFIPQAFLKAYIKAWEDTSKKVALVIEEINRGNCAQIFGDLFQLLDRSKGFSDYPINVDSDLSQTLSKEFSKFNRPSADLATIINELYSDQYSNAVDQIWNGTIMVLPSNLYIWATMNTSDQSLFPIDSAFKRRWDWKYVPINYSNTDWKIVLNGKEYSWVKFQQEINKRIKDATDGSEDKQMGDFFVNVKHNGGIIDSNLLLNKIVFYLWNDVCKDGEGNIFKILNDDKKAEEITFSEFFKGDSIKKLQQWMDYLNVKSGPDEENDDSEKEQDNVEPTKDEVEE